MYADQPMYFDINMYPERHQGSAQDTCILTVCFIWDTYLKIMRICDSLGTELDNIRLHVLQVGDN
jgi:hypothetical protein